MYVSNRRIIDSEEMCGSIVAAKVENFNSKPNFSISFDVKDAVVPEEFHVKWENALHRGDNPNLFLSSKTIIEANSWKQN